LQSLPSLGSLFLWSSVLNRPYLDKALKPLEVPWIPGIQRNPESQSGSRDPEAHDPRPGLPVRRLDGLSDGRESPCYGASMGMGCKVASMMPSRRSRSCRVSSSFATRTPKWSSAKVTTEIAIS
jgi:hypothetical protein